MENRKELRNRFDRWIDIHAEEMIQELQDFAKIRSVSRADLAEDGAPFGPECRTMLDYALKVTRENGFTAVDHAGYCGEAQLGNADDAIGIIAHLDVVPEGDKWVYPPYGATRVGDYLFGRGVSDNKGPAVMALYIMKMFKELNVPLKHGVRLIYGLAEETGMQDMDYFVTHAKLPTITLVPDAGYPVNFAQKSTLSGKVKIPMGEDIVSFTGGEVDNMVPPHCTAIIKSSAEAAQSAFSALGASEEDFTITPDNGYAKIVAHGIAAHAASPASGKSAINMLSGMLIKTNLLSGQSLKAMQSIEDMTSNFYGEKAGIAVEDEVTGKTTMNIGIAATEPDGCIRLHLDCRLSIATDLDWVQKTYRAYSESLGFTVLETSTTDPFYIAKDDPRVVALMNVYRELTGNMEEPYTMGGGTYSRCLKNAITFGPGLPDGGPKPDLPENHGGAHAPDEYTYIPNLIKTMKIYAASIVALDEVL